MTFIELLFLTLGIFLSVFFGRHFWKYIGWWSVIPAPVLGFGSVVLFWYLVGTLMDKLLPPRPRNKKEEE